MTFTSSGAGAFSSPGTSCTLGSPTATSSSCSVTLHADCGRRGTHTITGSYGPNALHESNSDDFDITVNKRATVMTVTCQSPRVINQDSSCTATLDDDSPGTKSPPAGSVSWSRAGAGTGTFTGAPCTLAPSDADSSTCSVTYSPTSGAGTHTITGSYGPNALHESNSDDFDITVNKRATVMTVTCQSPRVINQDSSCTATLDDDSPGTKSPPAGSVSWSRAGAGTGTFTGAPCTLAPSDADSSTCSVTYSPTSGAGTHTITGSYGPNALHESNSDDFDITVNKRATVMTTSPVGPARDQPGFAPARRRLTTLAGDEVASPAGSVSWSRAGAGTGTFTGAPCTLRPARPRQLDLLGHLLADLGGGHAHDQRQLRPERLHEATDDFDITVNKRATDDRHLSSRRGVINQASSCTATLDDDSPGTESPPGGPVSWSRSGAGTGTFTGASCTLAPEPIADSSPLLGRLHADLGRGHAHGQAAPTGHGTARGERRHRRHHGHQARDRRPPSTCQSPRVINQARPAPRPSTTPSPATKPPTRAARSTGRARVLGTGTFIGATCRWRRCPPIPTARPARSPTRRPRAPACTPSSGAYQGPRAARVELRRPTTSPSPSARPRPTVSCQRPRVDQPGLGLHRHASTTPPRAKPPTRPGRSTGAARARARAPSAARPCTLAPRDADSSTCSVTYTPTSGAGTHTVTRRLPGPDALHRRVRHRRHHRHQAGHLDRRRLPPRFSSREPDDDVHRNGQ